MDPGPANGVVCTRSDMTGSETWDYGQVPTRRWRWFVDHDPSLRCAVDKDITITIHDNVPRTSELAHVRLPGLLGLCASVPLWFLRILGQPR